MDQQDIRTRALQCVLLPAAALGPLLVFVWVMSRRAAVRFGTPEIFGEPLLWVGAPAATAASFAGLWLVARFTAYRWLRPYGLLGSSVLGAAAGVAVCALSAVPGRAGAALAALVLFAVLGVLYWLELARWCLARCLGIPAGGKGSQRKP